jgi:hypothetical protein
MSEVSRRNVLLGGMAVPVASAFQAGRLFAKVTPPALDVVPIPDEVTRLQPKIWADHALGTLYDLIEQCQPNFPRLVYDDVPKNFHNSIERETERVTTFSWIKAEFSLDRTLFDHNDIKKTVYMGLRGGIECLFADLRFFGGVDELRFSPPDMKEMVGQYSDVAHAQKNGVSLTTFLWHNGHNWYGVVGFCLGIPHKHSSFMPQNFEITLRGAAADGNFPIKVVPCVM